MVLSISGETLPVLIFLSSLSWLEQFHAFVFYNHLNQTYLLAPNN
jgi:hypothetical protein